MRPVWRASLLGLSVFAGLIAIGLWINHEPLAAAASFIAGWCVFLALIA